MGKIPMHVKSNLRHQPIALTLIVVQKPIQSDRSLW